MKPAFGSKRKARKIQVDEDDDAPATDNKADSLTCEYPITRASSPADCIKLADRYSYFIYFQYNSKNI